MAKNPNNPPLIKAVKDGGTAITSSSSSQRERNLVDLPFDVIIIILNRLTMKSLFQFRLVCRSWRALLSTREIAIYFNQVSDKKYTLRRNTDFWKPRSDVICRFKIPIELQSLEFMLLKPVNGILCICGPLLSHVSYVYLWNPITNEFKALPKPIVQMGFVAVAFGFGFVPSTYDYKVVRVIKHERKSDSRVEIYSLNRNSWKRVRNSYWNSEITGNEKDETLWTRRSHSCKDRFRTGDFTVDLEKEVFTARDDHKRKNCRTITWSNETDAILLTLPEDDLILCHREYGRTHQSTCRSSTTFDFSGSLVSLYRDHDDLGK
ncbi:Signal peptidase complex catalytic subunit [Datura stramonium]|uniref:Signal peptidase complex catalytic subunit n=1 Tax=Datura stramonium TaxID=4076 RepID=A0ABS8TNP1_DATST|nr:Signal peptidase complex catalytic subunit [Datura stramonium]